MVLRSKGIPGLDGIRFPAVDPWETYVLIIFHPSTANGLPISIAGSGKTVLWFVVSQLLSPVTVLMLTASSAIIQHIMKLRDTGGATLAYFYFDFLEEVQHEEHNTLRNAVTSLLIQLSAYSKPCSNIMYRLYSTQGKGGQRPSDDILVGCLKEMLTITTQHPTFIVMDALDECSALGSPTPREAVLSLVEDLVHLQLPDLHICVTSRHEIDLKTMLEPLAINAISLHEARQKSVIADYVRSVVSKDVRLQKWEDEDKELVIEELPKRADGM